MQGRPKSDAISLDDSQELEDSGMDDIQYTPEPESGTMANGLEPHTRSASRVGATGTRNSSRQQMQDIPVRSRLDSDEHRMLPTSPRRKPDLPLKNYSFVDLDENAKDSREEQEAVVFTKNAAERRRSGRDSSSPDLGPFKAHTRIESSYFTHPDRVPATARRKQQSPAKPSVRTDGSQSPDVIQQGTTTRETTRPNQGRIGPRKGLSAQTNPSLAAQIVGNPNSTQITTTPRAKAKGKESNSKLIRFEFHDVKCSFLNLPNSSLEHISFYLEPDSRTYFFNFRDAIMEPVSPDPKYRFLSMPYPTNNIRRVSYGENSSKVVLWLSNVEGRPNGPIGLDLESHRKVIEFIQTLQGLDASIPVSHKEDVKLDSIFENIGAAAETVWLREQYQQNDYSHSRPAPTARSHVSAPVEGSNQRSRVSGRLDNAPARNLTVITGRDRELASRRSSHDVVESMPSAQPATLQSREPSKHTSHYFGEHGTRAQSLRSAAATEKRKPRSPSPPKLKFSQTGGLGDPWAKPLTYPKDGKKRENVGYGELWRLDDDEFLNDTLIGFFLRYLQHRTEIERPEVLKKMHFFNSYFFDTLNKGTKNAKMINYEAVHRWTRVVDLFSRDFVIVPVNENLHWFVAIICNLPYFKQHKDEEFDDVEGESPPAVTIEDEEEAPGDQSRRTKETQESFEDLTIEDKDTGSSSTIPSSQTKAVTPGTGRGRKKKIRRSLPKYDTEKPVIITFDSLGIARSGICSSLKQYIVQEAKNRQGLDISDQDIKGMTAKNIPTQGNYSDCGLYMCMYLEQFMCDPHGFVQKLLQREETQIRWPSRIHSDELRNRMRNLILDLHCAQEGEQVSARNPELGKILVDMRGPSPEPEPEVVEDSPPPLPSRPTTSEELRAQKKRFSDHFDRRAPVEDQDDDGFEPEADNKPMSSSSQRRHAEEAIALVDRPAAPNEHNTVIIEDDGSPVKKKKRLSSPIEWKHKEPKELAAHLKMARASPMRVREDRSSPSKADRGERSHSVSTDFLHGAKSFANGDHDEEEDARFGKGRQGKSPTKSPGKVFELPAEVPETQEEQDESDSDDVSVEELKPSIKQGEGRAGDEEILV